MFAVLGSVRAASSSVFISRIGVREIILRFPSRCIEEHLGKLVAFEMLFCYLGNFFNGIRVVWVICIAGGLKTDQEDNDNHPFDLVRFVKVQKSDQTGD